MKFKNNQYEVATNLMKTPPLNQRQIEKIEMRLRAALKKENNPELPYGFLNSMIDLSYSGHFELAMKIASEAWPTDKTGLLVFKDKFTQALRDSLYWKNF